MAETKHVVTEVEVISDGSSAGILRFIFEDGGSAEVNCSVFQPKPVEQTGFESNETGIEAGGETGEEVQAEAPTPLVNGGE